MIVNTQNKEHRLPDFLIVGAAKSGTTSIYKYVKQHPEIFLPLVKEPHFFSYPNESPRFNYPNSKEPYTPNFVTDLKEYSKLFIEAKSNQIIGEASTYYLYHHNTVIENIKNIYGTRSKELKIVIFLRNPIERTWSHYGMKIRDGYEDLSFSEAIKEDIKLDRIKNNFFPTYDYLGFSRYSEQVLDFKKNFPQVKIILFDDLVNNPEDCFIKLFDFLEVNKKISFKSVGRSNVSGKPKNKISYSLDRLVFKQNIIKNALKKILPLPFRKRIKSKIGSKIYAKEMIPIPIKSNLRDIFRSDIETLGQLLDKDLSKWLD